MAQKKVPTKAKARPAKKAAAPKRGAAPAARKRGAESHGKQTGKARAAPSKEPVKKRGAPAAAKKTKALGPSRSAPPAKTAPVKKAAAKKVSEKKAPVKEAPETRRARGTPKPPVPVAEVPDARMPLPPVADTAVPAEREAPPPERAEAPATAEPTARAPAAPAVAVEPQELVMSGGSPFIRTLGYIQRSGGEPLPGFESVVATKMLSPALPNEPGSYEYRFKVRNGTGDFDLMQRTSKGATKNKRRYAPDPSDAFQTYAFSIP